ncbi:hypothetical protein RJ641_013633 [Dillenia turbinata]|uniref:Uncharacterized protein n=1 Tax=Dillenia turbinata TaxID=194707 RepID=A0AAN8W4N6_9MAGN
MKAVYGGGPCSPALLPSLILRRRATSAIACSSSYGNLGHISFIKDVAATQPPEHLSYLLKMLQVRGDTVMSPGARKGLIPLVIPLSKNPSGIITALLRWPTAPQGMEMPVVEVRKHGVWLLAKNVDQYIHRLLVEEDARNSNEKRAELFDASSDAGEKLYKKGDFAESQIANLDVYLLKKVGLFPDVLERKVKQHLENRDHVSALITGEFYTKKDHFPGFARPFVFNAEVLLKFEVADLAQWEDEQLEYIKEKVSEEGRQEDLKRGKAPEQVSLDEAAFLLDLASVEGMWTDYLDRIAECYKEAGLEDISRFILYSD